jgi:hypothetical protein
MRRPWLLFVAALAVGCGGGERTAGDFPCVVSEKEMASILGAPDARAFPQANGYGCIYAARDQAVAWLAIRSPQQFEAERARFEDHGVLLPSLEPVSAFDGDATVDPRYNSLNVTSGDSIITIELLEPKPADPGEQLDLEKRIAAVALSQL